MTEEAQSAPSEAEAEAVQTEGQVETQPAETPKEEEKVEEKKSASQARRERRKAEDQRLRKEAQEAKDAERAATDRLAKIKEAANAAQPPKQDDFTNYDDFIVAMAAHQSVAALDKRDVASLEEEAAAAQARSKEAEDQRNKQIAQTWNEQVAEGRDKYADFDAVVLNPTVPITTTMAELIAGADNGADIAYHLATNREEAVQIAAMEPLEIARQIGALEARLSLPKPKTTTTAPEPITPVQSSPAPVSGDPENMSMEEYRKFRGG